MSTSLAAPLREEDVSLGLLRLVCIWMLVACGMGEFKYDVLFLSVTCYSGLFDDCLATGMVMASTNASRFLLS